MPLPRRRRGAARRSCWCPVRCSLPCPAGVTRVMVESSAQLCAAVLDRAGDCDAVIQAAAPADFTPKTVAAHQDQEDRRGHGARARADHRHRPRARRAQAPGAGAGGVCRRDGRSGRQRPRQARAQERRPRGRQRRHAPRRGLRRGHEHRRAGHARRGAGAAGDAEIARLPARSSTRWQRCSRRGDALRGGDRRPVRRHGRPPLHLRRARGHGAGRGLAGRGAVRTAAAGGLCASR